MVNIIGLLLFYLINSAKISTGTRRSKHRHGLCGVLCEDCFERYTKDERTQSERDMGWEDGFHPASPEPDMDFRGSSHPPKNDVTSSQHEDADGQSNVCDARNIYEDVIQYSEELLSRQFQSNKVK